MFEFVPRWYQAEAEFSIFDYFERGGKGNPLVAMPTGTGKSVVIASFIRTIFRRDSRQRILMLTHVKDLIVQNAEKLMSLWPVAPLGIYSAGLKSRDMIMPIVFCGVQSVAKAIEKSLASQDGIPAHLKHFGFRDLIIIDECHLLSPDENTQYQYVIAELKKINPYLVVVGFTATHYRLKQGMLTDNGIFTDVCYDITGIESFNRLIAEGYLAPLITKGNLTQIDTSNVSLTGGEYNTKQVEEICGNDKLIYDICKEACEIGFDRNCWLTFAAGINNAEKMAAMLQSFGIQALAIHSKKRESDEIIAAYKAGNVRCIVNANKLTTGFDHPPIDFIVDAAPTCSPGRHVQKYGRGTRPHVSKINTLVGDFAGNTRRNGPINDPVKPRKPGEKTGGDAPIKICDCGNYNHASARFCGGISNQAPEFDSSRGCGMAFSFETKLFATAGTDEVLRGTAPVVEYFQVSKVIYNLHEKKDKEGNLTSPPSIKVTYFCGLQAFSEWICLEHGGPVAHRAREWWKQRHSNEPPKSTHMALQYVSQFRAPSQIRVHVNKKFPEILGYEF